MHFRTSRVLIIGALFLGAARGFTQELSVGAAKAGGVYGVGEKIVWRVAVKGEGADGIGKVNYVLRKGGRTEMGRGEVVLQNGSGEIETSLAEPGTILAEFSIAPTGKAPIKALAGAAVAPEKIQPSAPEPADFDAFWKSKVEELNAVPANPQLEAGESGNATVDYWKIELNNIRGSKVRGQLARPKNGAKLPALLIVQWAGVYGLPKGWAVDRAREGWLTLNINAHDLPIDQTPEFYKKQSDGPLKDYPAIGNDDRDKSYFLRMYLSCYRAADYLTGRDDWDGKTLVVTGGSQGGLQAIMTGGLHPKVSAVIANVPAGCDHTGPLVGRAGGWPMWMARANGPNAEKIIEASKYYDVVSFARRVKVPAFVAAGLIDQTCPPAGIMAAVNQMQGKKELLVMEKAEHQDRGGTQAGFYARSGQWLWALVRGQEAPVAAKTIVTESPLIAPGASVQKLADGFKFTEGPAPDAQGNVYFTDQPNNRIHKWSTDGKLSTFLEPAGRSNGLAFDSQGRLWACADEKNELWRIDVATGKTEVLLKDYAGKLFNGPNDVWVRPDGGAYFTDPFYKRPYWNRGPMEQDQQAVYFLSPDGKVSRVTHDLKQPNGLVGSADGKNLYVADIGASKTFAYDIQPDGTLSNKRLFCEQGSDGVTLDEQGNVYLTGKGVTVYNKDGQKIEQIDVPEGWTANVCFGGADGKLLFITASKGIYGVKMRVKGSARQ
jgi:sugar lactone lactonase YvrE/cephalosporin-C deacetylase-like acetyl esterase